MPSEPRVPPLPWGGDGARAGARPTAKGSTTGRPGGALGAPADLPVRTSLLVPSVGIELQLPKPRPPRAVEPRPRSERLNRAVNLVLSATAILVLSPLLLVIALLVKLTSPGAVLYTQTRVGQDRRGRGGGAHDDRRHVNHGGRLFTIYKFRSMRVDAEADGRAVWARADDERCTPIGRVLRRSRLDELPQLFNVLKGDMNIVGPRPERPCIFDRLRSDIEEYPLRQLAKPGITGWAQINHTYDTSVDDVRVKVRYDLEYLERQSLVEDLKIMAKTVPVMLFKKGGW